MTCTYAGLQYGENAHICQGDGHIYRCFNGIWVDTNRLCRSNSDGTFEDLGPAKGPDLIVDGEIVPAAFFKVKLTNGKDVDVGGPVALEVHDGALLLVDSQKQARTAWAPGTWVSVNG